MSTPARDGGVSTKVELRRKDDGFLTVLVDNLDIGNWIAAQPVTIRRRPNGTDGLIIELAAPTLIVDPSLELVSDHTLSSLDTTEHVIPPRHWG